MTQEIYPCFKWFLPSELLTERFSSEPQWGLHPYIHDCHVELIQISKLELLPTHDNMYRLYICMHACIYMYIMYMFMMYACMYVWCRGFKNLAVWQTWKVEQVSWSESGKTVWIISVRLKARCNAQESISHCMGTWDQQASTSFRAQCLSTHLAWERNAELPGLS